MAIDMGRLSVLLSAVLVLCLLPKVASYAIDEVIGDKEGIEFIKLYIFFTIIIKFCKRILP